MNQKQSGFIILLTLMLVAIATVLITALYRKGSLFVPFISTMYQREQAKMLALSGIQVALAQLSYTLEKSEKQKEGTTQQTSQDAPFFAYIFPKMHQWQSFVLKKDIDGIDGTIAIMLASEEGKINLNAVYDFVNKKFVGEGQLVGRDWKKIMQQLLQRVEKKMGISKNLFASFEKFMKQRHYKLNDASELFTIDAFDSFEPHQFYDQVPKDMKERPLYLFDLFTVYGYGSLQPWLLSDSVRAVLDMKRVSNKPFSKEQIEAITKKFKPTTSITNDWNSLFQPIYGIAFQRLPKGIDAVFETTFDPKLFSVVSYGKVGNMSIGVYAILERVKRLVKQKTEYNVLIKKFYWI